MIHVKNESHEAAINPQRERVNSKKEVAHDTDGMRDNGIHAVEKPNILYTLLPFLKPFSGKYEHINPQI